MHNRRNILSRLPKPRGVLDNMIRFCNASVTKGHSTLIAAAGILLGVIGLSMVGIGASWDLTVPGYIYTTTVKEKRSYYPDISYQDHEKNHALIYQGFMVFISVIPGCMHLQKRVRSTIIVLLSSLPVSLAGSILGAVMSGFSWKAVAVVYKAKQDGHCSVVRMYCTCHLPGNEFLNRTATMEVAKCEDIDYLHSTINAYFALSIISGILTTAAGYLSCMVCCTPEKKDQSVELCAVPAAEEWNGNNIGTEDNGLPEDDGSALLGDDDASAKFLPAEDGDVEYQDPSKPLLAGT